MNILIITPYFYPENFRINDLAIELKNKGHNISVLTPIPNYPEGKFYIGYGLIKKRREIWNEIKIYRSLLVPRGSGSNFMLAISWISSVIGNILTSFFLLNHKFDLIFVFGPSPFTIAIPAIFVKNIKKIPICFWVQDLWPESVVSGGNLKSGIFTRILNPLVKFIYTRTDRILVSSKGFIKSIEEKGINNNKIQYFPQWAENIFKPILATDKKLPNVPSNSFVVMFAGNIGESQDFESIIKAASKLSKHKTIHWVILGSGRKESWVKNEIKKLNIVDTFHLMGKHPLNNMPEYYSLADVMLISLKREYIFSLTVPAKLQSYLSCGKPILAMLDGETPQIIKEANAGLVCKAEDANGLAINVLKLSMMKKHELSQMGKNSINISKSMFSRKKLLNKLEQVFYKMINHGQNF